MTTPAQLWDEAVAEEADRLTVEAGKEGTTRKELEPLVFDAISARIKAKTLTAPGVEAAVKRSLDRLDQSRRTSDEQFNYIIDALNDDTILGPSDPMLDLMAVVGTGNGKRLASRYLTIVDLDEMTTYRRRKAFDVGAAFNRYADAVDRLKAEMRDRHVAMVGDLFLDGDA